jgi:hypothetical protein
MNEVGNGYDEPMRDESDQELGVGSDETLDEDSAQGFRLAMEADDRRDLINESRRR